MATDSIDEAATRQKRRELESAIGARARALRDEEWRLQQLTKQIHSLDATEQRSIEQLKTEIMRVSGDLMRETSRLRMAEARLADATRKLQDEQEEKRVLSEQLMSLLLDSEESSASRLREVEAGLKTLNR